MLKAAFLIALGYLCGIVAEHLTHAMYRRRMKLREEMLIDAMNRCSKTLLSSINALQEMVKTGTKPPITAIHEWQAEVQHCRNTVQTFTST